jgi:hypothetical protein
VQLRPPERRLEGVKFFEILVASDWDYVMKMLGEIRRKCRNHHCWFRKQVQSFLFLLSSFSVIKSRCAPRPRYDGLEIYLDPHRDCLGTYRYISRSANYLSRYSRYASNIRGDILEREKEDYQESDIWLFSIISCLRRLSMRIETSSYLDALPIFSRHGTEEVHWPINWVIHWLMNWTWFHHAAAPIREIVVPVLRIFGIARECGLHMIPSHWVLGCDAAPDREVVLRTGTLAIFPRSGWRSAFSGLVHSTTII